MKLLLIALSMLFVLPAPVSSVGFIGGADGPTEVFVTTHDTANTSIAIIGGADGPTAVFISGSPRLLPALCGFLDILFANAGR